MRIPVVLVALRVVVVQSSSTTTKTTTTTTTRASLALESCAFFSLGMGCKISKNSFYQNPQIQKETTTTTTTMMGEHSFSLARVDSVSSSSRLSSRAAGTTGWRTQRAATAHRIRLQKRGRQRGGDSSLVVRDRAATYGEEPAFRRKESKGGGRGRGGRGAFAFAGVLVRF